jgi:hypothetical protein
MKLSYIKNAGLVMTVVAAVSLLLPTALPVLASSHREAPLIAGDPKADATDLYAFVSPDKTDTVTIIANYIPFQEPAGGPNFYTFDDNVMYEIKVDSDGDAVPDVTYQFRFKTTVANPNTFLYNTGPVNSPTDVNLNVQQTYTLTRIKGGVSTVLGTNIPAAPSNVGPKSTPNYANIQAQTLRDLGNGTKVFAGQSDDPFYAELGGLFDLLTIRKLPGNAGGGVDGLKGYNVNSLAIQVPITDLTKDGSRPTDVSNPMSVIGVYTTASRQTTRVLTAGSQSSNGSWVQVSRLGAPLVNEVIVPLGAKDLWNGSNPVDDAQFANGVANPELGNLLKDLYGVKVPPQGNFGSASQRDDLEAIFLTGIPGLTKSAVAKPAEELRLNVAVPPAANPNRMGVLGGDKAGYPNGRRLADDVTDISIQAVAGAAYPLFHPEFTPDPLATQLGDGVNSNDVAFRGSFPYLALPFAGFDSVPHGSNTTGNLGSDSQGNGTVLFQVYNSGSHDHFYTSNIDERDAAIRAGYKDMGSIGSISETQMGDGLPLYRLYNSKTGKHFFTTNSDESNLLLARGYSSEGTAGYVHPSDVYGAMGVYRLYNARYDDHFYTTSVVNRNSALRSGYVLEGVSWASF